MKTKLKSANGFARFMLAHGEKLGIAAVLAVAGLLIMKSLGRERLGKTPDELQQAANAATTNFQSKTWEETPEADRLNAVTFESRSGDGIISPVPKKAFPSLKNRLDPPITDPIALRTDPALLPPIDVEVTEGSGLWLSGEPEEIARKKKEFLIRQQKLAQEAVEEQERMERDAQEGDRGRRRGRGRGDEGEFGGRGYGDMGGMGGFKTKDGALILPPMGGAPTQGFEEIRNTSWVTVLAKVPVEQQYQIYEEALKLARGYDGMRDSPNYVGYIVERAEITDKGQGPWQQLDPMTEKKIIAAKQSFPIDVQEIANPKYVHSILTFPLPPMVIRQWGEEITHPDIPLPKPEDMYGAEEEPAEDDKKKKEEPAEDGDLFADAAASNEPTASPEMYGRGEMGFGRGEMSYGRGEMSYGRGEMGGGYRGEMGSRGGEMGFGRGEMGMMPRGMSMGEGAAQITLPPYVWDRKTEFILFRYFDYKVQPGHRYRYRVKLVLQDVNNNRPEPTLDKSVSDRLAAESKARKDKKPGGYRFTDWSDESPVAVVPQSGLIYVADAEAPRPGAIAEPEARLLIKSLDADYAAEVAVAKNFLRGSVLNLKQSAQIIWSSKFDPTDEEQPEAPKFELLTGLTLLDFEGGENLNKNRELTAPARALLMDSSGRMLLREELNDLEPVRQFDMILEASKQADANRQDEGRDGRGGRGRGGEGT